MAETMEQKSQRSLDEFVKKHGIVKIAQMLISHENLAKSSKTRREDDKLKRQFAAESEDAFAAWKAKQK